VDPDTAGLVLRCVAIDAGGDPDQVDSLVSEEPIEPTAFIDLLRTVSGGEIQHMAGAAASVAFRVCVARAAVAEATKRVEESEAPWLLPSGRAAENLIRYEAHLQRALAKTLAELRTLQDRQAGGDRA
jgi:hypothetical protein